MRLKEDIHESFDCNGSIFYNMPEMFIGMLPVDMQHRALLPCNFLEQAGAMCS